MNIKRGLFRIWIVLSAIYVVVIAFNTISNVSREFWQAEIYERIPDTRLIPVMCQNAKGTANQDFLLQKGSDTPKFDERCWYTLPRYRVLFPEAGNETDDNIRFKAYMDTLTPRYPPHPWEYVREIALLMIIPPIGALLLGFAFYWALSGFRKQ